MFVKQNVLVFNMRIEMSKHHTRLSIYLYLAVNYPHPVLDMSQD